MKRILMLVLLLAAAHTTQVINAAAAATAPGDLDLTWGNGGIVVAPFGTYGHDVHIQPDGKIVVSGLAWEIDHPAYSYIARYNANGTPDASFGTNGRVIFSIFNPEYYKQSALQPDGKIVVGGDRLVGSVWNYALARYNADGTLDTTFGTNGKVITTLASFSGIKDLIVQPDGKIVAAGDTAVSGSGSEFSIVRYNSNGSLDTAFGVDGKLIINLTNNSDYVHSVMLQADGKIVIGGSNGGALNADFALVRLLPTGALDSTFGTNGKVITALSAANDDLNDLALQPDGKIIAAGKTSSDTALVRYNPNGSLDASFAANGVLIVQLASSRYYVGRAVALQPSGKILAIGYGYIEATSLIGFAVARYNADGTLDTSFGTGGRVITQIGSNNFCNGYDIALQPDGKIIASGSVSRPDEYLAMGIVRYLGDSTPQRATQFDFDGDERADIAVFRLDDGTWYRLNSSNNSFAAVQFGASSDRIVPADYDGDARTDLAVYRAGIWYLQRSQSGFTGIAFGAADDIPVPADFDGDGRAELAVYRQSNGTWYFYNSANNETSGIAFGTSEDRPIPADYDGDGKTDVAVFRPSNGTWYLNRSQLGFIGLQFGEATDKPVPADYDGDAKADIAVFRPSNEVWYLQRSQSGLASIAFGLGTDTPTPADYDGDGKADIAVFRNGTWYLQQSTSGFTGVAFGAASDVPVEAAYVP